MPMHCSAYGCTNRATSESKAKGLSFHVLPKDPTRREAWVRAIRRKDWKPGEDARICSDHFKPGDYEELDFCPIKRLRKGAVPSVFPAFPAYYQATTKDRRVLERQSLSLPLVKMTSSHLLKMINQDHNYVRQIEDEANHCQQLQDKLAKVEREKDSLRKKLTRSEAKQQKLINQLEVMHKKNVINGEMFVALEKYQGIQLQLVQSLITTKGKTTSFLDVHKDFALTCHFYSPKCYDFLRQTFTLPAPSTLRSWISTVNCMPGFQEEAFAELISHQGDITYADVALIVDGMSLKELMEYDPHARRVFGQVDYGGGQDLGEPDKAANEALVCMVVGLRKYWKLSLAYFLVKGVSGSFLAGIIRECLERTFNIGVKIWSVTMDGTHHNITAFEILGACLRPQSIEDMKTSFPHPSPGANYEVLAFPDPPHNLKLIRNTLDDYKSFWWPEKRGYIRWDYLTKLEELQEEHGLRLGNKLTARHINYKKNKMKVSLAVQAVASDSVARSLRWAHEEKIPGFESKDVIVTADFFSLQDKVFDICNCRYSGSKMYGFKRSLNLSNYQLAENVFQEAWKMYSTIETSEGGTPIIKTKRKTGFLGFLTCIKTVRGLLEYMEQDKLNLKYLSCYKMSQDHLEIFFNAVRLRNGWAYNPTPRQFRLAFRKLLIHAGKNVLGSISANCIAQDETALLSVPTSGLDALMMTMNDDTTNHEKLGDHCVEGQAKKIQDDHFCKIKECKVCSATIAYIGGFYAFILQKRIRCRMCTNALLHSEGDPCPSRSLILMKNYFSHEKGLKYPSGSLCALLYHAETVIRSSKDLISHKKAFDIVLHRCLLTLKPSIFTDLQLTHVLDTSDGTDNHYTSLTHLVLKKYITLRLKKIHKDATIIKKAQGNYLHRSRIFQNL